MRNEYLECGQILRSHGISGAMVVNHLCDSYEVFEELKRLYMKSGDSYKEYKVVKCTPYKAQALLTLQGISDPETVTKLRQTYLYAKREDILKDDDDYFIADLIGLKVIDAKNGEEYGTLKEVINRGAQDIYVVDRKDKPEALIPAIKQFIDRISLDEGIFITPIEGLID